MCIQWDIPTMGTPAREVQLQEDKEGIYVIRILLAKRYSPNLNHTKIRNRFGSEILAYICTLQGDSAGKRFIILRSFILMFSLIICLQLHPPQTDLKRYTYGSGLWAVSCGQEQSLKSITSPVSSSLLTWQGWDYWIRTVPSLGVSFARDFASSRWEKASAATHRVVKPFALLGTRVLAFQRSIHRALQVRNKNSLLGNEFSPSSAALSLQGGQTKLLWRMKASSESLSLWFILPQPLKSSSIVSRPKNLQWSHWASLIGCLQFILFFIKKNKLISTVASGVHMEHVYKEVCVFISITQSPLHKSLRNAPGSASFQTWTLGVTNPKALLVTGTQGPEKAHLSLSPGDLSQGTWKGTSLQKVTALPLG